MATTHYYDRERGEVVKRPPINPDYKAGSNSGRKQRRTDISRNLYPREGLPISRERGDVWVRAYQSAYYQTKSQGRPMLGDAPRVTVMVSVDRETLAEIDRLGVSRSDVFAAGARVLLSITP